MKNEDMNRGIILINLDGYLRDYVVSVLKGEKDTASVPRNHFIGTMLYRLLKKVPEDCTFKPVPIDRKKQLYLDVGTLGRAMDKLKRPDTYYYFPVSAQREFESSIRLIFDQVFFAVVDIAKEYTDLQYKELITKFCDTNNIDFSDNYDALVKKHYRNRVECANDKK